MFFEIKEDWEITSPLLNYLYSKSIKTFGIVQLNLNSFLFHVDTLSESDLWTRYLTLELNHAIDIIRNDNIKESRISLQTRLNVTGTEDYSIRQVYEILQAKDAADQEAHAYICMDGTRIVDAGFGSEKEFTNIKSIYKYRQQFVKRKTVKKNIILHLKPKK